MPEAEALLLIGHGSGRYPKAALPMHQIAGALRNRAAQVEVAVLNGSPSVADALDRLNASSIRVLPFFMEDGYFSRVAVPKAVATAMQARSPAPGIRFCPPFGIHPGIAPIIAHQALVACANLGIVPSAAAVVIVGHGSATAPGRALALHRHSERVGATAVFSQVKAACLEEPPFLADVLASSIGHAVVVIGFFANHGGHVRDDVPAAVAAAQARSEHPVHFHASVADDLAAASLVLDQATGD